MISSFSSSNWSSSAPAKYYSLSDDLEAQVRFSPRAFLNDISNINFRPRARQHAITFSNREIAKQLQQFFMVFRQNNLYFMGLVRISNKNLHVRKEENESK